MSTESAPTDPCPLCGSSSRHAFVTTDRNRRVSEARFSYRRCLVCGVCFLAEPPPDLDRYYADDYHNFPTPDELPEVAAADRYKLELLTRHAGGRRLVEIGPSAGTFAHLAKEAGFDVTAVEMDRTCCEYLERVVGVRAVRSATPEAALRELPPSGVIAMWQVIEHLHRPREVLEAAAANLEPGGFLIVATPNPSGLQSRALAGRWPHVDAPRHLALIPPRALERAATSAGFELIAMHGADRGTLACNRFGWESVFTRPQPGLAASVLAQLRLGPIVAKLMAPLERRRLLGSSYTAVFRK